jgi:hypothetical protein
MEPLWELFYLDTGKRGKSGSSDYGGWCSMPLACGCKKKRLERSSCSSREASDANYFLLGGDGEDRLYQRNKYSIA